MINTFLILLIIIFAIQLLSFVKVYGVRRDVLYLAFFVAGFRNKTFISNESIS